MSGCNPLNPFRVVTSDDLVDTVNGITNFYMDMSVGLLPSSCMDIDPRCYAYGKLSTLQGGQQIDVPGYFPYSNRCDNVDGSNAAHPIEKYLECVPRDEDQRQCSHTDTRSDHLQMAATLMFQVRGTMAWASKDDPTTGTTKPPECLLHMGGFEPNAQDFNRVEYQGWQDNGRFAFKSPNIGLNEGTAGSSDATWWVNGLLMYGVDGLCQPKRFGSMRCPTAGLPGDIYLTIWDAETAYQSAVKLLIEAADCMGGGVATPGCALRTAVQDALGSDVTIDRHSAQLGRRCI